MNRDKKVLLTFISAMLGALFFAIASNYLIYYFKLQIEIPLSIGKGIFGGLLHWTTRGDYPIFPHPYVVGGYWGSSDMAAEILGIVSSVLFVAWPIYLCIRKFIWKR